APSAAAETRHNGGAPKPLCVHGGLGAPPLCRLQGLAERGRCAAVSTLHRGLGHAPWSRRCIVVSATATHLSNAEISLEATRDRRVQQRDLPTSGPRSPQQWPRS